MFASLHLHNYRCFFIGAIISNIGLWMFRIAQDWLILTDLTDRSSSALGVATALQFLPLPLLAPFAGALADRYPKRWLLVGTQILLGINALVLGVLVASGIVELWMVYLSAFLGGVMAALDNPARQAFVSEMVPTRLLPNAVGLNATTFNSARLIGPGVAGLIIGAWGVAPAMFINGFSYLAALIALWAMRPGELNPAPQRKGRGAVREGIDYVRGRPDIVLVLVIVFMLGTFGMNFQLSNAVMATRAFGKGAEEFGALGSIMAIGTLAAALIAARRTRPRIGVILGALAGFSVSSGLLALAPTYPIYALLLIPTGLFALTVLTSANSTVQLATEPAFRGRVMALYMAIFLGGTPIGSPVIGWIGDVFGPRWTLAVGSIATGLTFAVATAYVVRTRQLPVQMASAGEDAGLTVDRVDEA
ncbi:MAG TPA: MFS transporter [Propionibacteriaceae bacterium]|nr:MFS transporter [Propionibacteriaceae bacterium]